MRNLKELMKDDSGLGILGDCVVGMPLLCCHGGNCIGSIGQSAWTAVATLITNIWTTWQTDRARWCMTFSDSMANVVGK